MPANNQTAAAAQLTQIKSTVANGVRKINSSIAKALSGSQEAPPTAAAAPGGSTAYAYTGLCDALNAYEQELVKNGTVEIANVYSIQFAPQTLAASGITVPGPTDYSQTPSQSQTPNTVLNPKTNSVNMKAKNQAVSQGTQIIQFIEMTMRNSTYITSQLKSTNNQLKADAKSTQNASNSSNPTTWFKITVNAIPASDKIDKKRNDFAYRITYTISTYAINEMQSQYFPDARFRGIQKVYNYWFTGQNTQVLGYEQSYNNQYINVLSSKERTQGKQSIENELSKKVGYDNSNLGIGPNKNVPAPASGQSDQQAKNGANNPASTGADYLYSFADQSAITLQIIGDPAWLVQGEAKGITASAFQFTGFYSDGTVNPDTQQVVFAINWNAPSDYNTDTGLMEINSSGTAGNSSNISKVQAQASAAYTATEVKSTFSKGKFLQELKGNALKNLNQQQIDKAGGRPTKQTTTTGGGTTARSPTIDSGDTRNTGSSGYAAAKTGAVPDQTISSTINPPNSATPISGAPVQSQQAPPPPTSNGGITPASTSVPAPLTAGQTQLNASINRVAVASGYTATPLTAEQQAIVGLNKAYTSSQAMAPKDA